MSQFINRRALIVNRKLRVANDVNEQDMGDLELDLLLDLGRHVPMRFTHILRCPVEQIKINKHAWQGWSLPRDRELSHRTDTWLVGRSVQYLVKSEAMNRLYFGDNLSTPSPTRGAGPTPPRRITSSSTPAQTSP